MNDTERTKLRTFDYIKEYFDIESKCEEIVNKKPKVSKNATLLYHNVILQIAQEYKQLFLEIADKKRK